MKKLLLFVIYCYSANAIAQKCTSGDCANGVGTYVFDNGNTYTGSFKNNKRDGKGVFTWVDGTVYTGDWVQGVKTGSGTNKYIDGTLYIGEFENNTMTGKGTYTLANGFSMKGIFKENVGVDVKYFDNKNNEISKETYLKSEKEVNQNYMLQVKSKLQIQNLTIPAPNGAYSMTDRAEDVKMEFSSFSNKFWY